MACCCWNPPWLKLQITSISLLIFALIAMTLGITNVCLQYTDEFFTFQTTGYFGEGIWSSFFALVAAVIGIIGSIEKIPETFTVFYRVQAAMSGLAIFATMLALGWDVAVLIHNPLPEWNGQPSYGSAEFLQVYKPTILNVWIAELVAIFIVFINAIIASTRLGCCCVVGCPSNSINPLIISETTNEPAAVTQEDEELEDDESDEESEKTEDESIETTSLQSIEEITGHFGEPIGTIIGGIGDETV